MTKSEHTRIKMRPSIGTPDVRPIVRLILRSIEPARDTAPHAQPGKREQS